jgi:hypothetical protein
MLKNALLPLNFFYMKNGAHQAFSRLEMVENTWWSLGVFLINNLRKRLATSKCFLKLLTLCMVATKHFLNQRKVGIQENTSMQLYWM